ncbi:eIF-2-alpha kinase activator GCN1 [Cichlidogyrus casuarinus]|uniref:EIF-2-alpha kinase activator GCN1 n=1 Tax=Cichlidogyrus casuarinus TaxID=1844966 RepID=A0ABD2QMF4_9PLAT
MVYSGTGAWPNMTLQPTPVQLQEMKLGSDKFRLACLQLLTAYLKCTLELELETEGAEEADGGAVSAAERLKKEAEEMEQRLLAKNTNRERDPRDLSGESESDDDDEEDESETSIDEESDSDEDEEDDEEFSDSDFGDGRPGENDDDIVESMRQVLSEVYPSLLCNLCRLMAADSQQVMQLAWKAMESLFARWKPQNVTTQMNDLRQGIRTAVSIMKRNFKTNNKQLEINSDFVLLPGFSSPELPLLSLIKIYSDCILHGRPDVKEPASQGLAECIQHSSSAALQKSVIKIIGPMIRVLGERESNLVRASIVKALGMLVNKCPANTRPFVTQLQATFVKALGDAHRPLRILAGVGLAAITPLTPKLDVLITELAENVRKELQVSSNTVESAKTLPLLPSLTNYIKFP